MTSSRGFVSGHNTGVDVATCLMPCYLFGYYGNDVNVDGSDVGDDDDGGGTVGNSLKTTEKVTFSLVMLLPTVVTRYHIIYTAPC